MIFVLENTKMSYLLSFSFRACCDNRYPLNNELESFLFYFRNQQCYLTWKNNRSMYFFFIISKLHISILLLHIMIHFSTCSVGKYQWHFKWLQKQLSKWWGWCMILLIEKLGTLWLWWNCDSSSYIRGGPYHKFNDWISLWIWI